MDGTEVFLYSLVGLMICGMVALGVMSANEKHDLQQQRLECLRTNEKTADYIKCVKPIEDREAQIEQDESDSAMISTTIMLSTAATIQ